jgi:hypothetical protein
LICKQYWSDFFDYPKSYPLHGNSKKKVIAKQMIRFIDLKPKQYTLEVERGEEKKIVKEAMTLTVDMYGTTLSKNKTIRKKQFLIRSQKQQIHANKQNKVALNEQKEQTMSKRSVCEDKIKTLTFGHYKL